MEYKAAIVKPQKVSEGHSLDESKKIETYVCVNKLCEIFEAPQKYDTENHEWILRE